MSKARPVKLPSLTVRVPWASKPIRRNPNCTAPSARISSVPLPSLPMFDVPELFHREPAPEIWTFPVLPNPAPTSAVPLSTRPPAVIFSVPPATTSGVPGAKLPTISCPVTSQVEPARLADADRAGAAGVVSDNGGATLNESARGDVQRAAGDNSRRARRLVPNNKLTRRNVPGRTGISDAHRSPAAAEAADDGRVAVHVTAGRDVEGARPAVAAPSARL